MNADRTSQIALSVLGCLLIGATIFLSPRAVAQEAVRHEVFIPMVVGDGYAGQTATPSPTPTAIPTASPPATLTPSPTLTRRPPANCDLSPQEADLVALLRNSPEQQRPTLVCDTILAAVARDRAQDMAAREYVDHVNPDGYGPNYLVREAGYPLPTFYDPTATGNNIESIGAGQPGPEEVWAAWMASSYHRVHLLGGDPFFAEQIEYGIGYHYDPGSRYRHYWVVITARRAE